MDIFSLGLDSLLNKAGIGSGAIDALSSAQALVPMSQPAPITGSPVSNAVPSEGMIGGDISTIIFSGKNSFVDTVEGWRQGIDPTDGRFKWTVGGDLSVIDYSVTSAGVLTFTIANNPASSNAIFIDDASPSAWPAVDIRRTIGTGSGIYIQVDSPGGYALDVLQNSATAGIHVISTATGGNGIPLQLQQNAATSTNYWEVVEHRGGSSPTADMSQWVGSASPNGVLDGSAGDILQAKVAGVGKLYVNTDDATAWTDLTAGGSSVDDAQVFTVNGTWTKPAGVTFVEVVVIGAGGGGGSGYRGANGNGRSGGGGGGGGSVKRAIFKASDLGATETITVGTGGGAGAAVAVNDSTGNDGGNGGSSSFGTWLVAYGGGGGKGGALAAGTKGGGGASLTASAALSVGGTPTVTVNGISLQGTTGPTSSALNAEWGGGTGAGGDSTEGAIADAGSSLFSGPGGGGGGHLSASNTAYPGSAGGKSGKYTIGGGAAGGAIGGNNGTAGATAAAANSPYCGTGAGGGGPATAGTSGSGGVGGQGAGGGGGASSANGFLSGAGGTGGRGEVKVFSW